MDIYRAVRLQLRAWGTFNVPFITAHIFFLDVMCTSFPETLLFSNGSITLPFFPLPQVTLR